MTLFRSDPENARIVVKWQQALQKLEDNEIISYEQLKLIGGVDPRDRRDLLSRARRNNLKERPGVLTTVRGSGIQRLPVDYASKQANGGLRSIRRRADREARKLHEVRRANEMNKDVRARTDMQLTLLGLVSVYADTRRTPPVPPPSGPKKGWFR